MTNHNFE